MSKIPLPNKEHKRQKSRRDAGDESAPRTHLQGRLEHSLKLTQPTGVFQAVLSYVALVWSQAIIIATRALIYTRVTAVKRQNARLASGSKILASTFLAAESGSSHAAQGCFTAGLRLVLDNKTPNPNHLC